MHAAWLLARGSFLAVRVTLRDVEKDGCEMTGLRSKGNKKPPISLTIQVILGGVLCLSALVGAAFQPAAAQRTSKRQANKNTDWSAYGGSAAGIRYSPLDQINRSNVNQLQVAWTFDSGEGPGGTQTQPLVVDGVLYAMTPKHNLVAVDAATGKQLWKFESGITGRGANRGVAYWSSGDESRIFASVQHWLYALEPDTGMPILNFGNQGRIDLREGLGRDPSKQSILLTTPGVVYNDLIIVGGRTSEGLPATPGDIRAYDVRTGKTKWAFHTIPRPGEFGYTTWPRYAHKVAGSANNWAGMVVDVKRGLVFAPTGSSAMDFYGSNRVGDNLFANTLLCLDANTASASGTSRR
jgi:quinoprotein glucose dehydrogenase